jgi:hypothetical protein
MKENYVKVRVGGKIVNRRLYCGGKSDDGATVGKVRTGKGTFSNVTKIGRQKVFNIAA